MVFSSPRFDRFAGRSGAKPIGVLDLGYGSFVCLVDPPDTPPSGHLGRKSVRPKACHGALSGPFFDMFFASILDLSLIHI